MEDCPARHADQAAVLHRHIAGLHEAPAVGVSPGVRNHFQQPVLRVCPGLHNHLIH